MTHIEQQLTTLGRELAVPEAPDLAPRVLARIGARRAEPRRRRLLLVLAAVAIAALLAALAIPDARSALLHLFRIGGDRIELVDELPAVAPGLPALDLGSALGDRVTLEEARRRAGYDLLELEKSPDAVYVGARGTTWFLYGSPDAVRLLVAQTPELRVDGPFILKKLASAGTLVEAVAVSGAPAYFLSGEPHVVMLVDELGIPYPETARLARDVLVWDTDGRTVRLEGDLTKGQALDVAESLR